MRVATVIALALSIALATLATCCDGAGRGLARARAPPEEEEEFRPRLYREYGLRRAARADDAFDDYGHLRFGRSDE